MQTYETIFITPPTLTEDEERTTVETLADVVTDGGGTFVANERFGRRRLAYPIEKHNDGVYVRFLYDSEAAVPKELERRFRISEKVLRGLTVRLEPDWAVAAKEQAVIDAKARVEAAEREKLEREQKEREEREAAEAAAAAPPAETPAEDPGEAAAATPAVAEQPTAAAEPAETPAAEAPAAPGDEPEKEV